MARYTGPLTKKSRRLGIDLVGGDAAFEKRPYPPGQHGRARVKESEYRNQLLEKQKARYTYGVLEKQFRKYYELASRRPGKTGDNLLQILESRLDNVVYRAGFARTSAQARQLIVHRHIMVDGARVDRPSFRVAEGQLIHVHSRSETMVPLQVAAAGAHRDVLPAVPGYLDVQLDKLQARLVRRPKRSEVPVTCEEQLVVEYYAR